jgi:PAS domain S-box-containing protein
MPGLTAMTTAAIVPPTDPPDGSPPRSNELLRLATEAAGLFSWEADLTAGTLRWSANAAAVLGCSPDELPAAPGDSHFFVHPEDGGRLWQEFRELVAAGGDRFGWEFRGRDGVRWWTAQGRVVRDAGMRVVRVVGVTQEVTDRKRAEAEAARLVEALRQADRRKDEFLAALSHELRSPLAALRTGVDVLTHGGGAVGRVLPGIDRQVSHMTRLVDDLLDASRVAHGKVTLRPERADLRVVADTAVELARPQLDAAGHILAVDRPPDPAWVTADPVRLAQVLVNLLTNAARYTPAGGRVTLRVLASGGDAVATVTDTGEGIPADQLERVFDPFGQAGRLPERTRGGLGLGLAIARGLSELHGGTLRAESNGPGQGSTFTLRLPLATAG